ncbi:histidine triad nucleotide-binding protein [Neptuniibacter pectenicola]|jgi:histidine triad (HIT) family protein|uniref:Histidine triad nucleotide-binding protein n=1 Tax=Neptuniibacter pectenicola TaxID=1806669 RepID=A0ABU9TN46_9GAMM|nr:histidine triad nucleotide-binding protein [Neptuniibacter pectenicola]
MDCLFCKIINKEIPAQIVYEDEHVVAFNDINPQAPTHLLIIPRTHISTLNDISETQTSLIGHMVKSAATIAKQMGFDESGYRTVFNCNEDGGQTVYHIHLHLLGGKAMGWPPYQDTLKTAIEQ